MILTARQWGHLHAVPKGCGGESWLKRYQRLREPLGLPQIGVGEYLIDAMFRLGPVRNNGMSVSAPDWAEIEAFSRVTGRISEPWEAEVLYDMCHGYHEARIAGEDPLAMSPAEIEAQELVSAGMTGSEIHPAVQ